MFAKVDLVNGVAAATGYAKSDIAPVIDAIPGVITNALAQGETVRITGLGTLSVKDVPARSGRNPQTGEAMTIPAHRTPKFKFSTAVKDAVN